MAQVGSTSKMKLFAGLVALFLAFTANAQSYLLPTTVPMTYTNGSGPTAPIPAASAGFNSLTFTSSTFSTTNVDTTDDCFTNGFPTRGGHCSKQWYSYHNSGSTPVGNNGVTASPGSCLPNITFSSGVLVLLGCKTGPNGQITTATPNSGGTDWAGTGFGCGAYFEWTAVMSDSIAGGNNTNSTTGSGGWQALWSQPIEFSYLYGVPSSFVWSGQAASYRHSLEDDAFEVTATGSQPYGSALHELYGTASTTCTSGNCQASSNISRAVSGGYVSTNSYRYAELWIPATATTRGTVQYFRNEVQQSTITQSWDQFTTQPPTALPVGSTGTFATTCSANNGSPSSFNCVGARTGAGQGLGNPTWLYGVHDIYHYAPIMGTGTGSVINGGPFPVPTLNISKFNVWQGTGACNISN